MEESKSILNRLVNIAERIEWLLTSRLGGKQGSEPTSGEKKTTESETSNIPSDVRVINSVPTEIVNQPIRAEAEVMNLPLQVEVVNIGGITVTPNYSVLTPGGPRPRPVSVTSTEACFVCPYLLNSATPGTASLPTANYLYITPFTLWGSTSINELAFAVTTASATHRLRFAIYSTNEDATRSPNALIFQSNEFALNTVGVYRQTGLSLSLPAGTYWFAVANYHSTTSPVAAAVRVHTTQFLHAAINTTSTSFSAINNYRYTLPAGAITDYQFPNPLPITYTFVPTSDNFPIVAFDMSWQT